MIVGAKQLRPCLMLYRETGAQLLRPRRCDIARRCIAVPPAPHCVRCRCNVLHRGRFTNRPYVAMRSIARIMLHRMHWRSTIVAMRCADDRRGRGDTRIARNAINAMHRGRRCDDAALRLSASAVPPPSPPPEGPRHDCQPLHPGQPGGLNPNHNVYAPFCGMLCATPDCLSSGVAAERSNEDVGSVAPLDRPSGVCGR